MHRLTSRVGRLALAVVALLLTCPGGAVAAGSTTGATVGHVETTGKGVQVLVSVPVDATVDLAHVSVTIDGKAAPSRAVLAASTTEVRRTAVLAIDTSNSMRGRRFAAAQQAALAFLDSVPDDVYVGVVAFASDVLQPLSPTLDRAEARSVISGLTLTSRTRLYDGVQGAVRMAGTAGQRTVLVLSDGADTSSTAPLADVTAAISAADVLVDVVALDQSGAGVAPLRALARAGHGRVISAGSGALSRAFSREAAVLARQILVTVQVPASVTASEANIAITLPTTDRTLTTAAFAPVRRAAPPDASPTSPVALPPDPGLTIPPPVMYVGVGALGVGLIVVLVLLVPTGEKAALTPVERVSTYTSRVGGRGAATGPKVDADQAFAQAKDAAASMLKRNKSLEDRISRRLEGAGSDLKSSEWLLLHAAIFVGAGLIGLLLGKGSLLLGMIFLVLGAFGPWMYLGFRRNRLRKAFNGQLPDTLQLMSGSMAAGLSLAQSVDTIVREGAEPVASAFKRVLIEARLGVSLEDALEGVAARFGSKDFGWVVMAIKIQRQVGGNLAELLDNVAATMREREYMRRQVAALAAEGKMSAWVLGGLPPIFLLYLVLANRSYVMPLFTEPLGWLMLLGAGTLLSLGVFWMSRLIKVEV